MSAHRSHLVRFVLLVLFVLTPQAAAAREQVSGNPSVTRWGLTGSFAPTWKIPTVIADIITGGDEVVDIRGREFSIGLVRGRAGGGDWGVSFVRKRIARDSTSVEEWMTCTGPTQAPPCFPAKTTEYYDNTWFPGVEVHWFVPIVRFGSRVQVGLNLAVGAARPSGTVTRVTDDFRLVSLNPVTAVPVHTEETPDMSNDWGPVLPIARVEPQIAFVVGRAFKVKFGGGLNFPGAGLQLTGVYFFGSEK